LRWKIPALKGFAVLSAHRHQIALVQDSTPSSIVIPANAGSALAEHPGPFVRERLKSLDSRVRGNDDLER
jgi:hypothetical protein